MTSLRNRCEKPLGLLACIVVTLALASAATWAQPPSSVLTTPVSAATTSVSLVPSAAEGTHAYPFTEPNGVVLSRGWYFGKPTHGRAHLGFVWENNDTLSSLSTIHLSTKGLRVVRRF